MSSSRRHVVRPVIVEVQPTNLTPSTTLPTTPTSPSTKAVRFAPSSNNAVSRPLSQTEAWSLYHFEHHARHCPSCHSPHNVFLRGDSLCSIGLRLAQDVAYHVYHLDGEFYSTTASKDDGAKLVRVEIPAPYTNLRGLLRSMDYALRQRRQRHTTRPVPIISYDRSYPIPARRPSNETTERAQVIVEPASSPRKKSHRHHSKHKSSSSDRRYSTVIVDSLNDDEAVDSAYEDQDYFPKSPSYPTSPLETPRRSAPQYYEPESSQRRRESYRTEIREPPLSSPTIADIARKDSSRRKKREEGRRERPTTMFWD
ncbi:unnamed protein product [Zymoseptoria tritici ST99CH_1A5]|uniref:Uncharacterized protein n=1 Tax=Zymoseptoria tritici ST99CH_1A5 TaxID=1276529 RepID=A0A1Y6LH24_ZYMTR|nr:unnamed protein product [Zymoseptoria tritici ST99CH_1A5]